MTTEIQVTKQAFVAEVLLNRPEKLNAVTPEMADTIERLCTELDRDDETRVILLRGAGERAFCAGSDLNSLAQYDSAWKFRNRIEYAHAVRRVRKPVVAALHGWVLGGGAEMALACDLRVMGRSARIGFPEVTRGWVGGGGASQMLPRLIGYGPAFRLLLTGQPIGAEEAARLGAVDYLVDDDKVLEQARAICTMLAGYSPVAVQSVKAAVRASLSVSVAEGLAYENEMNTLCFAAGDHREGIRAFQEKRAAEFTA